MIGREIALEALGALCNAEVIVVNRSDESRESSGDGSGGAELFSMLQLLRFSGFGDFPAVKPRDSSGDGSGGAKLFSIHHLIPRVLEVDQSRFTELLQGTDGKVLNKYGLFPGASFPGEEGQRGTSSILSRPPAVSLVVDLEKDVGQTKTEKQIKLEIHIDDKEFFDPGYDYDFTNLKDTETYYRGGEEYKRPCGYTRFALKVKGKYEDDTWLGHAGRGTKSVDGEWPVSYHGTKAHCVDSIIKGHLKAGPRHKHGWAIYSTPDITVAESDDYATTFISKKDRKKYRVILQNRINPIPECRKICEERSDYWLVKIPEGTSKEKEEELSKRAIRPYGLLIKEVK